MLDLGWSELLIIAVAALIVVGPKDLPRMLRTLGQYAARAKSVAREFQRSMDEAARQADLDELREVKKDLDSVRDSQYRMQREMSQSFLDEGKKPKKKGEAGKPAAAKPAAGNGEAQAGDDTRDETPPAREAPAAQPAPAAGNEAPEAEPKPDSPKREASAGKVGGA